MNNKEITKSEIYRGYSLAKRWTIRFDTSEQQKQIIDEAYIHSEKTKTKVNRDKYIKLKLIVAPPIT